MSAGPKALSNYTEKRSDMLRIESITDDTAFNVP
jgi:hypothetical protein